MKNLLFLTLISASALGQSVEINPNNSGVQPNTIIKKTGIGLMHKDGSGVVQVGTYAGNGSAYIQTHSNHPLKFTTNNGPTQFIINTDGKVGVGSATPVYWLDVAGRSRIKHNPSETAGIWYNKANNSEGAFAGMFNDDIYGLFGMGTVSNWRFGFDLVNTRMGIGTMTPKHPMTFPNTIGDKISFWGGNASATDNHYGMGVQAASLQLFAPTTSDNIVFGVGRSSAFTERVRITGTGNVGIGTGGPTYKLQVNTPGGGPGIAHTDNSSGVKLGSHIGNGRGYLGTFSNHPLGFFVNDGGAVFTITTDERFQFGGSAIPAGYKMSVDGKVLCTELEVLVTPWPDYVFKPNYQLKPLHEVEGFIQANGHLPNIPKAEEIENKALAVGNMSKLQMEKIEELTLYLIEINKRLKKVEEENEMLKKALLAIKSQN